MDIQVIAAMVFAAVLSGTSVWVITNHRRLKNEEPVERKEEILTKHSLIDHPPSSPIAPSSLTPTSLIVQNHHGERALAVTELPVAVFDRVSDKSRKPSKAVGRLNALLQAGPSGALAAQGVPVNVFEVAINGPLLNAKDSAGNVIEDTYRAMTNGGSGGIKEHGLLTKPESLSNAMNAAAVWQVASVVVAQKHLADISEKLDGIVTTIKRVEAKLDAQRRGALMGAMDTLREVSTPILQGEHSPHNRQTLEDQYQKMMDKKHEIHQLLKDRIQALTDLQDTQTFGASDFPQKICDEMDEIETLFQESLLCSRIRFQAWSLLTALPGEALLKHERHRTVQQDFDQAFSPDGLRSVFEQNITDLILRVDSKMVFKTTLANHRTELTKKLRATLRTLDQDIRTQRAIIAKGDALLSDATQPTRVLVKTQNNQVIAFKHLPSNGTPEFLEQDMQPSVFPAHMLQTYSDLALVERR
ncbi:MULTISPECIES: hypothetical protein [Xanthomonas]|uniref:hypothetical protein n=1 Tax=Xanthomonas TaxID=338 RepID=UPI00062DBEBE|nr:MULTISPECIES: hypothetical protein [Xanthomonas]KLA94582.1 hypothetical protein SM19410_17680 [Xanthomonas hortorum pv. gardneri]KLB20145.1 hypothetical protein SM41311_15040 [Xanthomonas hortorum pv. gardneri]KLB23206.1 hypothetical protein SM40611_09065 [Xanthomonas hortorum pv. gardneri]KLB31236.1 hypothetical protein SM77512_03630 [Xanthomonas hortorum pv. gardneri]KLB32411.1 hypothetical protein SM79512_17575 [Xanthomonas hortorum pv. gardneri]